MSIDRSEHRLQINGRSVPLVVRRHPQARRLKLRYDPRTAELRLTLPPRGSLASALVWAGQQGDWVARQLAVSAQAHCAQERIHHGALLPFGDAHLLIDWQAKAPRQPQIDGERLVIGGPEAAVGRRVGRWLADQARERFSAATRALADGAGLPLRSVSVCDPKSRWGSCSASKSIRYSCRLMMAPVFVQDSVIAHEVAHLAHLDHSPRFHRLAEALLGTDPAPARAWLRRHGADLQRWDFS